MAPKGVSNWRRPYTSIYNDNYKYGTGLYSDTLSDIEKRYSDSISKTQLRSDRPDLGFTTFLGSSLTSSPTPGGVDTGTPTAEARSSRSPMSEAFRETNFESRLKAALHTAYDDDTEFVPQLSTLEKGLAKKERESPRPKSLYDDAVFWSLPKAETSTTAVDFDLEIPKRRKPIRETTVNGPSSSGIKDKSRDLQNQVDLLEKSMSDTSSRLRSELSNLKGTVNSQLHDLNSSGEVTSQQASDLQKTVKKQASQLAELQAGYDDSQRQLLSALEEMDTWHNRCKALKKEMDRLRDEVDQAAQKSGSVSRA